MTTQRRVGVGIIGAGNISSQYLKAMRAFPVLDDPRHRRHEAGGRGAKAAEFGVKAMSVDALLADPEVDIIVNLTIPRAHVEVGLSARSPPASTSTAKSRSA